VYYLSFLTVWTGNPQAPCKAHIAAVSWKGGAKDQMKLIAHETIGAGLTVIRGKVTIEGMGVHEASRLKVQPVQTVRQCSRSIHCLAYSDLLLPLCALKTWNPTTSSLESSS
jgi:hypothetical protein